MVAVAEAVFALRHGVRAQRGLQVGADQGALLGAEQVLGLAAQQLVLAVLARSSAAWLSFSMARVSAS